MIVQLEVNACSKSTYNTITWQEANKKYYKSLYLKKKKPATYSRFY